MIGRARPVADAEVVRGAWMAGGSYFLWGLLPIYWKLLDVVPAQEILAHRMVWSLGVTLLLLAVQRRWGWVGETLRRPRVLATFAASALLLGVNWFTYIWAVNAGFIVESSLGYFFTPLFSAALGVAFLGERLRGGQTVALAIAALGVIYLTVQYGALPWIALTLAGTFGLYGLIRKTAALDSLQGLTLETMIVFLPALGYLLTLEATGRLTFGHTAPWVSVLLAMTGVLTAAPLLLFAAGARLIPLTLLGVLQYLSPTMQFLLGTLVFGETLSRERLIGFILVWSAVLIYTVEGVRHRRVQRSPPVTPAGLPPG